MDSGSTNPRGENQSMQKYFKGVGLIGCILSHMHSLPREGIRVVLEQQPYYFENKLDL